MYDLIGWMRDAGGWLTEDTSVIKLFNGSSAKNGKKEEIIGAHFSPASMINASKGRINKMGNWISDWKDMRRGKLKFAS